MKTVHERRKDEKKLKALLHYLESYPFSSLTATKIELILGVKRWEAYDLLNKLLISYPHQVEEAKEGRRLAAKLKGNHEKKEEKIEGT